MCKGLMIGGFMGRCEVRISIFALLVLVAFLVADFSVYMALLMLAALIHEVCHVVALHICGGIIDGIFLYPFGAEIRTAGLMSYRGDFAVALSGPLGNIVAFCTSLIFDGEQATFFAAANLALAVINLIPAKGLDGAKLLDSVLFCGLSDELAQRISHIAGMVGIVLLCILSIAVLAVSRGNFSVAFVTGYLLIALYGKGQTRCDGVA